MKLLSLLFVFILLFSQQNISNDTINWSKDRPLKWSDFKAEPIEGIGVVGSASCLLLANFDKPSVFHKTKFNVDAVFDRNQSWVSKNWKTDQAMLFYQTMFNQYEAYARKLRKILSELESESNPKLKFHDAYNRTLTELRNEFGQLNRETKMGTNLKALLGWKIKVDKMLQLYDEY